MTKPLTFGLYLRIMSEDAAADQAAIQKLQADISAVDAMIIQRTAPLNQRKNQLTKLLMQQQKAAQNNAAKPENDPTAQQTQMQANTQAPASNGTTTPGGTGAGTPGG